MSWTKTESSTSRSLCCLCYF